MLQSNDEQALNHTVTMRDVARLAGVSVASVSNYLADYPYMRESTKKRIAQAIGQLGYVTNEYARSLRSGHTGLIALSIPSLNQTYFAQLAEDIIAVAQEHGYNIIVQSTSFNRERELATLEAMATEMTDGLILSPLCMSNADMEHLHGSYPLVLLGEKLFGAPAPHILVRNIEATQALTEHLIQTGCQHIAMIGGSLDLKNVSTETLRTQGYLQALKGQHMPLDLALVVPVGGKNIPVHTATSQNGALALRELVESGTPFDGIVCYNDLIAFGVLRGLRELGIKVPQDVPVVSLDNLDEAQYSVPSLTSADLGRHHIAQLAVNSVLSQIANGTRSEAQEQFVDYEIMFRESAPLIS